jgi:hypothetical protein
MIYILLTQTPENNHEGDKSIDKAIFSPHNKSTGVLPYAPTLWHL